MAYNEPSPSQVANVPAASGISLSSNIPLNVCSLLLQPGTYLCSGIVNFSGLITLTASQQACINTVSATLGTSGLNLVLGNLSLTLGDCSLTIPSYKLTITVATTIYLIAQCGFALGSAKAYGTLIATKIG